MNKDRRTYEPQDQEDVRENPYGCPKTDSYERMIDHADRLRDEQKDRRWEEWYAKKQELAAQRDAEREAQP